MKYPADELLVRMAADDIRQGALPNHDERDMVADALVSVAERLDKLSNEIVVLRIARESDAALIAAARNPNVRQAVEYYIGSQEQQRLLCLEKTGRAMRMERYRDAEAWIRARQCAEGIQSDLKAFLAAIDQPTAEVKADGR